MAANAGYYAIAAASAYAASKNKPQTPSLPPPVQPPQQAQAPNVQGIVASLNQQGAKGPAATFLTGTSGVDPNMLKLGKPTLLGE